MQIASATKFFFAVALSLAATASASTCTSSQEQEVVSAAEALYTGSDCASINSNVDTATKDEVCDSSCMDYIESIVDDFPDCEYAGTNYHSLVEYLLSECGVSSNAAVGVSSSDATLVCISGVATAALALAGGN